jgi:pyridoxal phosphate enzyme (YggS family)
MHKTVINNLIEIKKEIQLKINKDNNLLLTPKIIAVSKTFPISDILPLINFGHLHFGENKVQEAVDKWLDIKIDFKHINLHMVGKLQTNKVRLAVKIFDYIHSLDSEKLAKKIADEQIKLNKKTKIFIQINIGNEEQKSGIDKSNALDFYKYCKSLHLDIVGIMCIPPKKMENKNYFHEMNIMKEKLNLIELSMGMSEDFLEATENQSTFLRIGSKIFGKRA